MFNVVPNIERVESKRRQRTLARQVDVAGFGHWSGQDVVYSFRPAPENSGVRFFRVDLPNSEPIPALVENRVATPRQTSLVVGEARVDMVEHALAALRGARIDNCDVLANAVGAPGLDGSGAPFVDAFLKAGTVEQEAERVLLRVVSAGTFFDERGGRIEVAPSEENRLIYEYRLHYDKASPIPNQVARFDFAQAPEIFQREIAPCRTFLTFEEAIGLRNMGFGLRLEPKDVLVFGENGPIDNALKFENECARHKILDMIGDFSLAPVDWEGEFRAFKTGHQQNADALRELMNSVDIRRRA